MKLINPSIFELLWQGILQTSAWEWIGVATSVIYVILAAKRSILCWIFALISSACYIYICFMSQLYIETILQFFYFGMGIVGWVLWNQPKNENQEVTTWGIKNNLINIVISGLLTGILGYIFDSYTDQANPYVDAFITSYCLSATYMITKKVHEGWIYLIIIDLLSIFLYGGRGLYVSSCLYIMFTVIAIFGWIEWYRKFKNSDLALSSDTEDKVPIEIEMLGLQNFCIKHKDPVGAIQAIYPRATIAEMEVVNKIDWEFIYNGQENNPNFILLSDLDGWSYILWSYWDFDMNLDIARRLSEYLHTSVNYYFVDSHIATCRWILADDGVVTRAYYESHGEKLVDEGFNEIEKELRETVKDTFVEDIFWDLYLKTAVSLENVNSQKRTEIKLYKGTLGVILKINNKN